MSVQRDARDVRHANWPGRSRFHLCGVVAIALVSLGVVCAQAQTNVNHVSVNAGIIRALDPHLAGALGGEYVFYPEVQVGGDLFTPGLRWVVFWGYADDGARAPYWGLFGVYSSHAVGVRVQIRPEDLLPHWVIPVGIFAGAAYHAATYRIVSRREVVETAGQGQISRRDLAEEILAFEAGVNLEVRIIGAFGIRIEGRQSIPLSKQFPDRMMEERRSITGGVSYAL